MVFGLALLFLLGGTTRSAHDTAMLRTEVAQVCAAPPPADLKALSPLPRRVQDAAAAVAIALPVFEKLYGHQNIDQARPYKAESIDEVWFVSGTLSVGAKGGTAVAVIDRKTGQIRCPTHEK